MNPNRPIDAEDLTLYALQFLSPAENEQIRHELEGSAALREELGRIQGDLASYALTADLHSPPALARERLMSGIARERKPRQMPARVGDLGSAREAGRQGLEAARESDTVPSFGSRLAGDSSRDRSNKSSLGRVLPWIIGGTGWAVAAGLTFAVLQANHQRDSLRDEVASVNHQIATETAQSAEARRIAEAITDPTAQRVTLTLSKQAPVPQGRATYVPARGALLFAANNLEPLEPYKVYELWLIPNNGQAPIPAGTFHPDEKGNASLNASLPPGLTAKAFGITIENDGGSQTPTMPIIMAGAAGL